MKSREKQACQRNRSRTESDPMATRRCFWVFVAIFSVTVFGASAQIASGYWNYCETVQRVSPPLGFAPHVTHLAGAGEPIAAAPLEDGSELAARPNRSYGSK